MDVQMPEMDGVEATMNIRNHWQPEDQPVIVAMTAHALEGDRERFLGLGMDNYVSKPVRIEDLVRVLNEIQPKTYNKVNPDSSEVADLSIEHEQSFTAEAVQPSQKETTPAELSVVDFSVLDSYVDAVGEDASGFLKDLVVTYLENAARLLQSMDDSLAKGDVETFHRTSHTLKSSSASLGAMRLSDLCKRMELASSSGCLDGMAELLSLAHQEYERAKPLLSGKYE